MTHEVRYDSSGRVQPIEGRNLWYPGTCALCGKVPERPEDIWGNLQVDIEQFGNLYLCLDCCAEIANFIKFVPPADYEKMKNAVALLAKRSKVLSEQLDEAKGLLNARIDSAGSSESDSNGIISLSLFEVKSEPDYIDSVLNSDEPVTS